MRAKLTIALGLVALAMGCGEREKGIDVAPMIVDRARLGGELLFADTAHNEVDILDVMQAQPSPTVQRIPIRANPQFMIERRGGTRASAAFNLGRRKPQAPDSTIGLSPESSGMPSDQVIVLSDGSQDAGGDYIDKPTLTVIDRRHKATHYELSVPFSELLLSGDGRYALLWGQSAGAGGTSLLNDPNRVALVDLDNMPSASNPFERTLKATGGAVTDALITMPLVVQGSERPIAVFSFANGMNVWDLANPDHEDITVTVDKTVGTSGFALNRVVADPVNAKLYLLLQGETVLRVLSFGANQPGASNDFGLSWNQLSLDSSAATDLVLYEESATPKVLVAAGNTLRIVDINNSKVSSAPIAAVGDRLHSFFGASPRDNDLDKQRVLVWGEGRNSVAFVELANLEKGGTQNVELLSLGSYTLTNLVRLDGNLLLTVLSGGGIGTLDLDSRRFRPLASAVDLGIPLIESDAHRVWVGGGGNDNRLGFFEPETLAIGSVRLDNTAQEIFLFEKDATRRIVAVHDNVVGEVTIVDAKKVTRASSQVLSGFLVDGWVTR